MKCHVFNIALYSLLAFVSLVKAAILFSNGTIIAYNTTRQDFDIIRDGSLLVEGDRIKAIYNSSDPSIESSAGNATIVDISGKIVSPGFVDTHHHLWQSAFKTLNSNGTLAGYFALYGENGLGETKMTPEDTLHSQLMGALESLNAGVTSIVDHAHGQWSNDTVDALLEADMESGARIFYGFALHNLTNGWSLQDQIRKYEAIATKMGSTNTVLLGLAFDFFYTARDDEIMEIASLINRTDTSFITSHYLSGAYAVNNSPELLQNLGFLDLNVPMIFSHSSFLTERDMQILRDRNHYIATTPESELQLLFDSHNTSKLIQDQAALGVDTNYAFSADMMTQARMWLQRLRGLNSEPVSDNGFWPATSPMSVKQAFHLATRSGGLSVRRTDLGVIAVGAKADLVVFDGTSPSLLGWNDPIAAIILHAGIGDIQHVLVDGKFVKRDFRLTHQYYPEIVANFTSTAMRLQKIWLNATQPDLSKGTIYQPTVQIDTLRGPGSGY